ncbi:TPA: hypothetical protein DIU27_00530 [Candidatus Collierbacteria bacterium]|uniref:Glycosyltransferase RgtA/B/C/D-like domain-containing protein n=1 Tax=Candidatus Collierbacteria bacterium GW2011_GWB2_44_22 TaxID=1618387 RepID=A0A0G1HYF0_9BACT|nr:MAG: hypothetical protein UW31_C0005G0118 [Candidatus Collierbacteria bacterium GW2011_GWA2_44_13]KKT49060.1 MAG: hypothetical protein UW42_C0041G0009 [Candidatus Collierbacteria bacterium GW2011_GWB1_44_197]KKT51608.1 MAG: hypothetical protein UW44_C0010G0046 [Candidatus Collierbacteria bacterium GW2011_GWB2_44_22]KKT63059.1 MAG: hypothetical protein UW56_C0002G0044 [Candidatus Collierbacteria bacterium GW2011_GWD1_44_27]KKT66426.1 MAG: hypothetical protein UW58_C0008G0019 [Candidatus Colli
MGKRKLVIFLVLFPTVVLVLLNFLLVFTPEMGFDALWYHLTLPKLWLLKHQWYFPGGLLYYSSMPRLAETVFIPLIQLFGTAGPKMAQYLAGVGTGIYIWKIIGQFKLSTLMKAIGISLFYCTWLVSWQSGSAYIDLIRTFFEAGALYFLLNGQWKSGGVFLGLAIGTKWFALGSLAIYSLIFGSHIIFPALLMSLPWFIIAYHSTGNPIYPIFSGVVENSFAGIGGSLKHIFLAPYYLTKPFDDFISPMAGMLFIISLFVLRSKNKSLHQIALVGVLGTILTMSIDPPSSRYFLPYLPALAIGTVLGVNSLKYLWMKRVLVVVTILSGFFVLSLRLIAMAKYVPFLTGKVDTNTFLVTYADRLPGTFIDSDTFVAGLPEGSKILVDKLHNLYYFPKDFDHTSWVPNDSGYDYLVTVGENPRNVEGELINENKLGIQVFKLDK